MLFLTWHEFSKTTKEPVCDSIRPSSCKDSVCDSITPRCMPDHILTPPTDESVITYTQFSGVLGVDTQSHVLPTIQSQFSDINLSFVSQQATASHVIDDVMRQLSFDEIELDGEACFVDVAGSGVDSSGLSHDESFGVDNLDLNLIEPINLNVSTQEPIVAEVSTQEPIVAEVSTEVPIVEEVGTQEFSVEDVVVKDYVSSMEDGEDAEQDDDDDVYEDSLVDEENEIVDPDVDVHLFGISMDLPFDNIGITNLVSDDVLEGEDVDAINVDGFDSDPGNDEERNYKKRRLAELRTEMKGGINASARPSGSSGPTTRSKKRKNTGTNDDSQASPSFLDVHDKIDLCPWVLYVGKDKFTHNWVVKTYKDTYACLQSREIKHCTYKFLYEKIFEPVRVNPNIPVKAVQDQLQRELEVQISMSKAFRADEVYLAFGGNTHDLGSFEEETDETVDLHQHCSRISPQKLETASQITRDAVTNPTTTASQDVATASARIIQPII
ncbi:hypothetical protein Tco_0726764 [Tanacetum coccineum]|uniref:Uncharacterized protein n=1 Tax=Tanacetum coccineum TaxID=301880 RepID=A0ABQ4YI60_9ASTR